MNNYFGRGSMNNYFGSVRHEQNIEFPSENK
jgi:hypothetical protein